MSIFSSTNVLVCCFKFCIHSFCFFLFIRGAELYAQNPNLIKKDENRVRADEVDQEYHRQSTLPTTENDFNLNRNISLDL